MWKSWNPFRRKGKDDADISARKNEAAAGKENTADDGARGVSMSTRERQPSQDNDNGYHLNSNRSADVKQNSFRHSGGQDSHRHGRNGEYGHGSTNGHTSNEEIPHSSLSDSFDNLDNSNSHQQGRAPVVGRRQSLRSKGMGVHDHLNMSLPVVRSSSFRRPITSSLLQEDVKPNLSALTRKMKQENLNQSFSGVHGPLLSTPIVPKVRRALEASAGMRSPNTPTLLSRGKPVKRSASLNYGSSNPARSTAGQVPWVRLKRKESVGLSDIVSGNIPHSPNTVKLAAPEPRHLPAAPSFKTTPLIVTTEPSRARIVDTQTVVSALREKRKRFGTSQHEESHSEDSWISTAKRRRQDSSQSNASSVSIPPMPESLPNLMGTPGASLLHIENLTDQRPSTVPAVDAFISHHQREMGLGGDGSIHQPQQQLYHHHHQQQPQLPQSPGGNRNNSKSVLRSIQASLSSSMRARTNLALLQQGGVDLKRMRQSSQSQENTRRMSFSSDVSMQDQSREELPSAVLTQASAPEPSADTDQINTTTSSTSTAVSKPSSSPGTVSTPTKRKIAEGVVLRKHNLAIRAKASPNRPLKALPASTLFSISDFEKDREKEYRRRVLDLLDGEDTGEKADTPVSTLGTVTATTPSSTSTITTSSTPVVTDLSSAATSAAVSASLDSLNKLVQSAAGKTPSTSGLAPPLTSTAPPSSVGGSSMLAQLIQPDTATGTGPGQTSSSSTATSGAPLTLTGKPLSSPSSTQSSASREISFAATTSATTSQTSIPATQTSTGFNFAGPSSTPAVQSTPSSTPSSGFQVNFGSTGLSGFQFGSAGTAVSSTTPTQGMSNSQQVSAPGFTLSSGSSQSASGLSTTSGAPTVTAGFNFSHQTQTTTSATGTGPSGLVQPSVASITQTPTNVSQPGASSLGTSGVFGPGSFQASASPASFNFSSVSSQPSMTTAHGSTAAAAMSGQPTTSSIIPTPNLGFNFSATSASATTAPAASSTGGFTFTTGGSTSASLPSGFSFGSTASGTTPAFNFGAGSATTSAPAATAQTTASAGFTFGATSSVPGGVKSSTPATAAPGQAQTGFNFGVAAPGAPNPASSIGGFAPPVGTIAPTFMLGGSTLTSPSATSGFGGFGAGSGAQTQTSSAGFTGSVQQPSTIFGAVTSTSATPATNPSQSIFGAGGASFGTTPQPTQQGLGVSTAAPAYPFQGGSVVTTANTAAFAFGQTSSTGGTAPKPFVFGGTGIQPGAASPFGMTGGPQGAQTTTAGNVFGGVTTTSSAVPGSSIFGAGSAPPFGGAAATSPFGSQPPTTSAPAFGASTATSPPAFGATSAFGTTTTNNQSSSMFGATAPNSNQPFTFGATTAKTQANQPPAFGTTPSTAFGGAATTPGSSIFGVKPSATAPAFGSAPSATGSVFGAPSQTSASTATPFGGTFNASGFGTPSTPQQKPPPPFGATPGAGFGTPSTPAFGGQTPAFNSPAQGNPPPFGAQPNANPSPFGGANVSMFGAGTQAAPPFGGTATTTQSGFSFTGGQPQQASGFGAQPANPASTGFNFGQAPTQPSAGTAGGFNFAAARPAFQAPSPGGFNFAQAAGAGQPFNFAATPNMFTPPTVGSAPKPRSAARRATRRGGPKR